MTLISDEELNRRMTPLTFLAFLPMWFRYYGLPGPVRFLGYLVWKQMERLRHIIHKRLVLEGMVMILVSLYKSTIVCLAVLLACYSLHTHIRGHICVQIHLRYLICSC